MRKLTVLASVAALVASAAFARAESESRSCIGKAGRDVLTVDALLTTMIEHGYRIRGLDTSEGCGKFQAVDRTGAEAVLVVDLSSGAKVGEPVRRND